MDSGNLFLLTFSIMAVIGIFIITFIDYRKKKDNHDKKAHH